MDIHELNQEAVRANERYAQTMPKESLAASPIPVEDESPAKAKADPTAIVDEDTDSDGEGEVYTVPAVSQVPGKREAPEHVVRSLASVALGAGPVPAKLKDASEDVDPLLVPTFGQFLDLQVLPLYVADVPFAALSNVVEDHTGLPLDSDDETRVWTQLGRPSVATEAQAQRTAQKRRRAAAQTARRAGKADAQPPVPPLSLLGGESGRTREALMQMLTAAAKPASGQKPLPRAMMGSSVVEKRRTDRSAPAGHQAKRAMGPPPDMPWRRGSTSSAALATSRHLGRGGMPTPLGLVSERSISRAFATAAPSTPAPKRPAPSPQSLRGSGLTRSQATAAAESGAGHTAMFDLMADTPQTKTSPSKLM